MRGVHFDGTMVQLRRDVPEPVETEGETCLHVRMAGICDTDIQLARGYMNYRGILGHEFVGTDAHGKRFTSEINASCQVCAFCLSGRPNHCPKRTVLGILGRDGAMADQVLVPTRNLHAVPDSIDDREAVFIEPLAAAFRIREQVEFKSGDRVAVLGDGKLGLLCAWVLREVAKVTLIGKHVEKLKLAGEDVETRILHDPGDAAFHVVVDATGQLPGLHTALGLVRAEGTIVLKTTIAGSHELSLSPVVIDEVRVVGSRCGPFPPAIEAIANKRINVRPLIEHEYSLNDAEEAFRAAEKSGAKKILIRVAHN